MEPTRKKITEPLSIVIPTFNGEITIGNLLSQLRAQSTYADAEIIVVDSSSTDGTVDCARHFGARVISIDQANFNHGTTRNRGILESRGKWVCLFTQDALPITPNYLETLVRSVEKASAAGGFARQIPRPDASPLVRRDVEAWIAGSKNRRIQHMDSFNRFLQGSPFERYLFCVFDNVASIVKRDVWEKIPFPATPFGEDIEWAYRILCNGYTLVYEPDAVVQHSHERSPNYVYKRIAIDHYHLYQIFGLRTVPSRWKALQGFFFSSAKDFYDLGQQPEMSLRWFQAMMDIPRYAWSAAWGQYDGAKAAARGEAPPRSKDV